MTTDPFMNDADQKIAAFADGELDGEQNLEMLNRMAKDPSLAQRVTEHQKLRVAVGKAMGDPSIKTPDSLRDQIMQMAREDSADTHRTPARQGSPVLARIGRWAPAAVAAVLLFAALVVFNQSGQAPTGNPLVSSGQVLNASMVNKFGDRHNRCARHLTPMHGTDQFPQDLDALPGALSSYFHQPIDEEVLNLSALGYDFDVAGLCLLPGKGSVHIIYQSQTSTGKPDTLSLWLRPYEEGSGIELGKLYKTANPQENFPMLVWRGGDMVYYIVGDSHDAVERAFHAISQNQG